METADHSTAARENRGFMEVDSILRDKISALVVEEAAIDSSLWAIDYDENGHPYYYNVANPELVSWELPEGVTLSHPEHEQEGEQEQQNESFVVVDDGAEHHDIEHHDNIEHDENNPPNELLIVATLESQKLAAQIKELEAELESVLPLTDTRHKEKEKQQAEDAREEREKKVAAIEAEIAAAVVAQKMEEEAEKERKEEKERNRLEHRAKMNEAWEKQHGESNEQEEEGENKTMNSEYINEYMNDNEEKHMDAAQAYAAENAAHSVCWSIVCRI